jgi:hypothetical protein
MSRVRRLLLVLRAQGALLRAWRRLRRQPPGSIVAAVESAAPGAPAPLDATRRRRARAIERAVGIAATRGIFRPLCLVRAMAIHSLLEAHSLNGARIRVGVRLDGGDFAAHAWVEFGDIILGDTTENVSRYVPLSEAQVVPLP